MSKLVKRLCLHCLPFLLTIPLTILVIPCLALLYLPFFIYRQLVIQLAAIFKKDTLVKILTTRSSVFIAEKVYTSPRFALISLMLVEGVVDMHHVREMFRKKALELIDPTSRQLRYPELKQNVQSFMGFPFWRKLDNFDMGLDDLIYFHSDSDDENAVMSTQDTLDFIKSLLFKPFSKDKPLWEIIVIPNFIPDPNFHTGILPDIKYSGVICRMHHSVADAFSQLRLIQALSPSGDNYQYIKPTDYTQKSTHQGTAMKLSNDLALLVKIPFALSKLLTKRYLLIEPWTELYKRNRKRGSISVKNDLSDQSEEYVKNDSPENMLARLSFNYSPTFPLTNISDIKKAHANTVSGTAILYAAIVGAARNTIFAPLPRMPENILIVTPLPLPGASGKLRNHVTSGSFTVPLWENDPMKRLRDIHKNLENLKHSPMPIVNAILFKAAGSMPSFLIKFFMKKSNHFIMVSNVAGPKSQVDFVGYPARDMLVTSGAGLGKNIIAVGLQSIAGHMRMSVKGDKNVIESDEKAAQFSINFFKELDLLRRNASFEHEVV